MNFLHSFSLSFSFPLYSTRPLHNPTRAMRIMRYAKSFAIILMLKLPSDYLLCIAKLTLQIEGVLLIYFNCISIVSFFYALQSGYDHAIINIGIDG